MDRCLWLARLWPLAAFTAAISFSLGLTSVTATGPAAEREAVRTGSAVVSPATDAPVISADGRAGSLSAAESRAIAFEAGAWPASEVDRIDPTVFTLGLKAARCAASSGTVTSPSTLTIIDYSQPSTEPRLWVLDLARRAVIYEELVAHGQGSGGNIPTRFSNEPESHQTSIGLFATDSTYVGRNGYSLKLDGLEPGFNDRARERAIVMHGAPYVNADISKQLGRLGRSHGCPAVREPVARELIDRVKGGGLVFAYYPDRTWLENSRFLTACE